MDNIVATEFGIQAGDGLQTRSWAHGHSRSFTCVLCSKLDEMHYASTTLFNGQQILGDLCEACVVAGPIGASMRAYDRGEALRVMADVLQELAVELTSLDPACWSPLEELRAEHEQAMKVMRG